MAGEISSLVAQAATPSSWVDVPVLRSAPEADAARLADLLSAQGTQAQAPHAVAPATAAEAPQGTRSLGESILLSLDSAGRAYKAQAARIDGTLGTEGSNLTMGDLLRVQFQLIDTSLQVDLLSKVISKGVQHIDQMIKLQ